MKVRVTLTIDVDPESWSLAYNTGTEPKAVREDVRAYIESLVRGCSAQDEGGITDVELH